MRRKGERETCPACGRVIRRTIKSGRLRRHYVAGVECPGAVTTSPGHGGAGQTSDGKEGEDPADGREESVPGPVDGVTRSPARDAVPPSTWLPPGAAPAEPLCERLPLVESPYERILLPAGGVRFRRTEEPVVKLLREVGREIDQMLEDEDPGYFERVRARLFGGGGT